MGSYIYLGVGRNSYQLPQPKRDVTPTIATVISEGRNANAEVVGQKVGRTQYKIDELEWPWLSASQWSTILTKLENFFVDVTFTDPITNKLISIPMYCGNRTGKPYWLDNNNEKPTYYRNCKVNLIDTGRGKITYLE